MLLPIFLLHIFLASIAAQNIFSEGSGKSSLPYYRHVPTTSFRCENQQWAGYYSDPEADCQVFHICIRRHEKLEQFSFLCPNETVFHQQLLVCVWWDGFECDSASSLYYINEHIFEDRSGEDLEAHVARSQSKALVPESRNIELENNVIPSTESKSVTFEKSLFSTLGTNIEPEGKLLHQEKGKSLFSTHGPNTESDDKLIHQEKGKSLFSTHGPDIEPDGKSLSEKKSNPVEDERQIFRTNSIDNRLYEPEKDSNKIKVETQTPLSIEQSKIKSKSSAQNGYGKPLLNDKPKLNIIPQRAPQKEVHVTRSRENKKQPIQSNTSRNSEILSTTKTTTTRTTTESYPSTTTTEKSKITKKTTTASRIVSYVQTTAKPKFISPTLPPVIPIQLRKENIRTNKNTVIPTQLSKENIKTNKNIKTETNRPAKQFQKTIVQPKLSSKSEPIANKLKSHKQSSPENENKIVPEPKNNVSVTKSMEFSTKFNSLKQTTPKKTSQQIFTTKNPLPKSVAISRKPEILVQTTTPKAIIIKTTIPTTIAPIKSTISTKAIQISRNPEILTTTPRSQNIVTQFRRTTNAPVPVTNRIRKPKIKSSSGSTFPTRNRSGRLTEYDILHDLLRNVTIIRSEALLKSGSNERRRNTRQNLKTSNSVAENIVDVRPSKKPQTDVSSKFVSSRGIERNVSIKKQNNKSSKKSNRRTISGNAKSISSRVSSTKTSETPRYLPEPSKSSNSNSNNLDSEATPTKFNKFLNIPGVSLPLAAVPIYDDSVINNIKNQHLTETVTFASYGHFDLFTSSEEVDETPVLFSKTTDVVNNNKNSKKVYTNKIKTSNKKKLSSENQGSSSLAIPKSSGLPAIRPSISTINQNLPTEKHFTITDGSNSSNDESYSPYLESVKSIQSKNRLYVTSSTPRYGSFK